MFYLRCFSYHFTCQKKMKFIGIFLWWWFFMKTKTSTSSFYTSRSFRVSHLSKQIERKSTRNQNIVVFPFGWRQADRCVVNIRCKPTDWGLGGCRFTDVSTCRCYLFVFSLHIFTWKIEHILAHKWSSINKVIVGRCVGLSVLFWCFLLSIWNTRCQMSLFIL